METGDIQISCHTKLHSDEELILTACFEFDCFSLRSWLIDWNERGQIKACEILSRRADGVTFVLAHNIQETLEYEYVALNNNLQYTKNKKIIH